MISSAYRITWEERMRWEAFTVLPEEEAGGLRGVWALGFNPFSIMLKKKKDNKTLGTEWSTLPPC